MAILRRLPGSMGLSRIEPMKLWQGASRHSNGTIFFAAFCKVLGSKVPKAMEVIGFLLMRRP
ncbi:hypothetical protein LVY75_34680 (plasmid) [Sinorhizobium sp. B11]